MVSITSLLLSGDYEAVKQRAVEHPEEVREGAGKALTCVFSAPQVPLDVVDLLLREDMRFARENELESAVLGRLGESLYVCCFVPYQIMLEPLLRVVGITYTMQSVDRFVGMLKLLDKYAPECWTKRMASSENLLMLLISIFCTFRSSYPHFRAGCQYLIEIKPSLLNGRLGNSEQKVSVVDCIATHPAFEEHRQDALDLVLPGPKDGNILHRMVSCEMATKMPVSIFIGSVSSNKRIELMSGQDSAGDTPLHRCLRTGRSGMVDMLLDRVRRHDVTRASMRVKNEAGELPLDVAILSSSNHDSRERRLTTRAVFGLCPSAIEKRMLPNHMYALLLSNENPGYPPVVGRSPHSTIVFELLKACPVLVCNANTTDMDPFEGSATSDVRMDTAPSSKKRKHSA